MRFINKLVIIEYQREGINFKALISFYVVLVTKYIC